jgi:hypothetical protein
MFQSNILSNKMLLFLIPEIICKIITNSNHYVALQINLIV